MVLQSAIQTTASYGNVHWAKIKILDVLLISVTLACIFNTKHKNKIYLAVN